MKNNDLFIEYAYERGNSIAITPDSAKKGTEYICPQCEGELDFKKGNIRRPHFAHKAKDVNCTPEGVLHKVVKNELAYRIKIQDYLIPMVQECVTDGCDAIVNLSKIKYSAFGCYKEEMPVKTVEHFNNTVVKTETRNESVTLSEVKIEHRLSDVAVADIALLLDDEVVGVIEVYSKSRVSEEKWDYLTENEIYCIEIDAKHYMAKGSRGDCLVLRSNVDEIRPNTHPKLPCRECYEVNPEWEKRAKQMIRKKKELALQYAREHDLHFQTLGPTMMEKLEELDVDTREPFF